MEDKIIKSEQSLTPKVVKDLLCKNASDQEIGLFLAICKNNNLDPFKREVYLVKYGDNPAMTVTGYETYLKRAESSGKWNGYKVWTEGEGKNLKAVIEVYRKDWDKPFTWEVDYAESVQNKKDGTPNTFWRNKPKGMLKKVAISQGLRLAFPDEVGGLPYTNDEMPSYTDYVEVTQPQAPTKKQEASISPDATPVGGEEPIDIMVDLIGGKGEFKDRIWKDAPMAYLKSMQDPKYWDKIPQRKQDAIVRTIAYKNANDVFTKPVEEVKADTTKVEEALFSEQGELSPEIIAMTEQTLKDTLEAQDEWVIDPKREKEDCDPKLIEFVTFFLNKTTLFTQPEKDRIINSLPKLNYNLAIAQLTQLKTVYTARWLKEFGALK